MGITSFLKIKKLTGQGIIKVAARHNLREIVAELGADGHISPDRVHMNLVLRGQESAEGVAAHAANLLSNAGISKLRKDAVRGIEIVFGLPPTSGVDEVSFFTHAVTWAERFFNAPILSAVIHQDEAAPHCHVLMLPLVDGRMTGSDMMGNRARLQAIQNDFHAQVGEQHGLNRHTPRKRASASVRHQAINSAMLVLEANSGLTDAILRVLVAPHLNNPTPLLQALGLAMPQDKVRGSFAATMTKPCKPEKKHVGPSANPIGFDTSA